MTTTSPNSFDMTSINGVSGITDASMEPRSSHDTLSASASEHVAYEDEKSDTSEMPIKLPSAEMGNGVGLAATTDIVIRSQTVPTIGFPQFTKLPAELQLRVWRMAALESHWLVLQWPTKKSADRALWLQHLQSLEGWQKYDRLKTIRVPDLFHACYDARETALRECSLRIRCSSRNKLYTTCRELEMFQELRFVEINERHLRPLEAAGDMESTLGVLATQIPRLQKLTTTQESHSFSEILYIREFYTAKENLGFAGNLTCWLGKRGRWEVQYAEKREEFESSHDTMASFLEWVDRGFFACGISTGSSRMRCLESGSLEQSRAPLVEKHGLRDAELATFPCYLRPDSFTCGGFTKTYTSTDVIIRSSGLLIRRKAEDGTPLPVEIWHGYDVRVARWLILDAFKVRERAFFAR